MYTYFRDNKADHMTDICVAPLLTPIPMSPGFESAMRLSPQWLAAAQLLLADVRDEISDLVTQSGDDSIIVSRRRKCDGTSAGSDDSNQTLELESPVSDLEIDITDGDELEIEYSAEQVPDTENYQGDSRVGSSLDAYLKKLRNFKAPSLEEENELVHSAQDGHIEAINLLVSRSLRVVPPIARTFIGRGLPLEDLIEEGNFGIYRAISRFDINLGYRFATYARWWIKHEIRTAVLNQGRLIRLPIHIFKALSRVRRQLEAAGESMPGSSACAARTNKNILNDSLRFTLEEAQVLLKLTELPLSLDMPSVTDPENSLVDTIPAHLDDLPENCVHQKQRNHLLMDALQGLALTERDIILRRYGFQNGEPETLQAIGKSLKLTAERVRQIQQQALNNIQKQFEKQGLSFRELL